MVLADAKMRSIIDTLAADLGREADQSTGNRLCCGGTQAGGLRGSAAGKPTEEGTDA
jgi:hypothetical protein